MAAEKKEILDIEEIAEDIVDKVKDKAKKAPRIVIFALIVALVMSVTWGYIGWQSSIIAKKDNLIEAQEREIVELNKKIEELIDKPHVTIIDIKDKLETIGELATYKYNYTAVEKYEDFAHLFKAKLDFTKSSYIVRWSGVIKAGIDTEKVTKGINPHTKTITIGLPAAQILSHDPDEENAEILELKENIFNPISVESVYEFDAKVKKELEAKAIEEGLLEKARENAEAVIESIFYSEIEKYGYTIKFVDSKK